jgi:phosphatidate phosphatase APP1
MATTNTSPITMGVLRVLFLFLMVTRVTSMVVVGQQDTGTGTGTGTGTVKVRDRWQCNVIKKDENVIFFPTSCYQSTEESNEWILPIHGWIFDPEKNSLRRRAFVGLLRRALDRGQKKNLVDQDLDPEQMLLEQAENGEAAKTILTRRVSPFIVNNHRRRQITIQVGNVTAELAELSGKNGHFQATLQLTQEELNAALLLNSGNNNNNDHHDVIRYHAVTGVANDPRCFEGTSCLVPSTGLSVISDIDDTVKISHVLEKKRLMRHTFLEEFQAVPGMAQLYQSWKETHNASFHFVSSSPWQLYPELASFFSREGFPDAASFHLKTVRLKDRLDRTLLNLFADPMTSKIAKISSILDVYPKRTFLLVGDTGERDPEVYGEICRRYPNQVQRVFLRDVTSDLSEQVLEHLAKKEEKRKTGIVINAPDRYEKAFEGVPSETWSLFTDATTIEL